MSSLGHAVDPENARISVFDRGFLYGDSVYETLRTSGGRYVDLRAHLDRLRRSASGIALEIPFSDDQIVAACDAAQRAAENQDSRIRVVVTRGGGPMQLDPRGASGPELVVFVQELVPLPPEAYEAGISAQVVGDLHGLRYPGLKTGNYLPHVLALRHAAVQHGSDDAILCNAEGWVTEGATANLFMVEKGRVLTPPLEVGLLAGITRSRVIQLAREEGLDLEETKIRPDRLRAASEVFLTSSVRGVMPVTQLDGVPVGDGGPGAITRQVMDAYARFVAAVATDPDEP
jgi:branched-chain amino acid aminotransferase